MEVFLSKITQQAMNYAIRSGITITSGFAIKQCSRLLKTVEGSTKDEITDLQLRLESKIRILSPAIDMIELIAARGNTSLESAVSLTKSLRFDIQSLGIRLSKAASDGEAVSDGKLRSSARTQAELEIKMVINDMKRLLARIEDAVPLINLAITTSGASLSTDLPRTVSASRLLQASTFLTAADTQYSITPGHAIQVGPSFHLSMYMLFSGHANRPQDRENIRETTWKEVIHKAKVRLLRVPLRDIGVLSSELATGHPYRSVDTIPAEQQAHEFAYQLLIVEDLDDDRVHTFEDDQPQPGPFGDVAMAGIRTLLPIHEISKIFYADTGKILNIGSQGEANNPVLLLKRDVNAALPRRMVDRQTSGEGGEELALPLNLTQESYSSEEEDYEPESQNLEGTSDQYDQERHQQLPRSGDPWSLPPNLDPEWMAFEVFVESSGSDDDEEPSNEDATSTSPIPSSPPLTENAKTRRKPGTRSTSRSQSLDPSLASALSHLHLENSTPGSGQMERWQRSPTPMTPAPLTPETLARAPSLPPLRTSLSLLELLIRLTSLQQFQQTSHLSITDELLNFFLSESSTVGAGNDSAYRQRVRAEARRRVGFDPYDESPVKWRTEDDIAQRELDDREQSVGSANWESRNATPKEEGELVSSYWQRTSTPDRPAPSSPSALRQSIPKRSSQIPGVAPNKARPWLRSTNGRTRLHESSAAESPPFPSSPSPANMDGREEKQL
ncbi:Ran-binding-domain-containing protein [Eremomyces bilateralis CBS 781.70]|uniref:Ran-binding-domain-containing protein n=1 Tax=Eremomyces bilateralis CBS 781.70 TaxID=1392243 RepID=A0A6G1FQN9_9PEZI|nr:Ran-binding-domain-containing protein [Eremomyces bilateralis CBS 781.70]KAF1808011.1 Ran-binding-domain-containing protein [Eremomyces bilateralis CBS 781.70]